MSTVTRDIRIDAAPEVVRRHLLDPDRRRRWLGEDIDVEPAGDGVRYDRRSGDDRSHVRIDVVPDGDGSRVVVTEEAVGDTASDQDGGAEAHVSILGARTTSMPLLSRAA